MSQPTAQSAHMRYMTQPTANYYHPTSTYGLICSLACCIRPFCPSTPKGIWRRPPIAQDDHQRHMQCLYSGTSIQACHRAVDPHAYSEYMLLTTCVLRLIYIHIETPKHPLQPSLSTPPMAFASGGLSLLFVHPQPVAAPSKINAVALNPLSRLAAWNKIK